VKIVRNSCARRWRAFRRVAFLLEAAGDIDGQECCRRQLDTPPPEGEGETMKTRERKAGAKKVPHCANASTATRTRPPSKMQRMTGWLGVFMAGQVL